MSAKQTTLLLNYQERRALENLLRAVLDADTELAESETEDLSNAREEALEEIIPDAFERRQLEHIREMLGRP
jgi:Mn-dependent DtxR family transcriptional regulator